MSTAMSTAKRKVGEVDPRRIPVISYKGLLVGHLGPQATSVSAEKFGIRPGAELVNDERTGNRLAWLETAPPQRSKQNGQA
jgi:hypothetical protein